MCLKHFTFKGKIRLQRLSIKLNYFTRCTAHSAAVHHASQSGLMSNLRAHTKKLKKTFNTVPHHKPCPLNIRPQIKSPSLHKKILDVGTDCACECGCCVSVCVCVILRVCVVPEREACGGKTCLLFKPISL